MSKPTKPYGRIAFSAPLVPRVLDTSKTATRRIVRNQPPFGVGEIVTGLYHPEKVDKDGEIYPGDEIFGAYDVYGEWGAKAPYTPDQRLLMLEGYQIEYAWRSRVTGRYLADNKAFDVVLAAPEWNLFCERKRPYAPTPARFMYGSLSRALIQAKAVRAEWLQEITEEDAQAEGVALPERTVTMYDGIYRTAFANLWDSINKQRGFDWDSNPLVWAIRFEHIGHPGDYPCGM
jgi:hypothetical protein